MACYPAVVFLYCFCGLVGVWAKTNATEESVTGALDGCREETYACTRLYSVHQPMKTCLHTVCTYSLRRTYVINKELCTKTVCPLDEQLKAELCRQRSGWPKRLQRSTKRAVKP